MPSRKKSEDSPVVSPLKRLSLRSNRSAVSSNGDSPAKYTDLAKQSPIKIKLTKLSTSTKSGIREQTGKAIVKFVNDERNSPDFLIKDFRKIVTIRNAATSSLGILADDEDDADQEALLMLGKYGRASKLVSDRSGAQEKCENIANNIGGIGFKTPIKKGQMFERTQEILASVSSPRGTPASKSKPDPLLCSPKTPTDKLLSKMANTPSGKLTPARRALVNSTIAAYDSPSGRKSNRNILQDVNMSGKKSNANQQNPKDTPLKQLRLQANENSPPTPHGLRKRVTRNLQKIQEPLESESSDSSSEEEEQTTQDEDATEHTNIKTKEEKIESNQGSTSEILYQNRATRSARKENTDLYFDTHGKDGTKGDRIFTSDNTLGRNLKTPLLSPEELKTILNNEGIQYHDDIKDLLHEHRRMFNKWLLWLWQDFNIMTYGLGSKRDLLSEFHQHISKFDPTAHVLVVNGYFPSLSIRHIFTGIIDDLLEGTKLDEVLSKDEGLDQCEKVFKLLAYKNEKLYLIIHNIDGLALRTDKIQGILAKLASNERVRLVASIDHINAPLLWDADKRSKFNFVWYEATTFLPYTEETLNENSLMLTSSGNAAFGGGNGGALALSSLSRVFASLTPNAKEIYLTIVKYQLETLDEAKKENNKNSLNDKSQGQATYQGLSFKDLYRRCRRAFLVNSDLTLRAQLTEFRDHKLIRERKGVDDGIDYLVIPLNTATLAEFLEQRNSINNTE